MQTMALQNKCDYGFVRVASAVPRVNVADVDFNVENIIECYNQAKNAGAQLLVLPELCVTAYTCADLFASDALLDAAKHAISTIKKTTLHDDLLLFIGVPIRNNGHLYNCAIAIQGGRVLGVVPKSYVPNYKEFYEKRWFSCALLAGEQECVELNGEVVPFGCNLLFNAGKVKIAAEICEDLWAPIPPGSVASVSGANIIVNLSASNEVIGKHNYLVDLIKTQSARCIAAYVYSSAGYGESSTDLVFAGNAIIAENGKLLATGKRFAGVPQLVYADVDVDMLNHERCMNSSFADSALHFSKKKSEVALNWGKTLDYNVTPVLRNFERHPFIPSEESRLNERCEEIVNIQTMGLMRRMSFTHIDKLVVGVSGGLDSTLALLVACRAFDKLGYARKNIYGITMPGFGTTGRTYNNALKLMKALGITVKEISIVDAVKQHFRDIEHDIEVHNVTYENGQARERTQILMDYSNKVNALVLGTGDLSELALGWATYNGDHMSMYNVNGSIPKTLVRHLVKWFATWTDVATETGKIIRETLLDVFETPISPELTPADSRGNIQQKTEDLVGPYELHDFFLYHTLRNGYSPAKIYMLAKQMFEGEYEHATIKKWLTKFYWRFFSQQFKRSCMPDGPKVGSVSLSPRGDWRMPSDVAAAVWIKECENLID